MRPTGFVHHPDSALHLAGPGHPERPERVARIQERLAAVGLLSELDALEAPEVEQRWLRAVHSAVHLERVEAAGAAAPSSLDADTHVSPGSLRAARLSAGGALEAARRVATGRWKNAFVCLRPPGHHAERDRAMGFCLYNNVAVAARWLRLEHGVERVAILDWDVHHGNGTQEVFEEDPSVFYASLHQFPLYPGSGRAEERGRGDGEGTTRNAPRPPGAGDAEWLAALEEEILPELEAFAPGFVLVSAGFDAHREDPLAATRLTEEGFRAMTRLALELARRHAGGRLVSLLEGGYHLEALARSAEAHVGELAAAEDP